MPPPLLAGHAANFQFWADEVAHCLSVIDAYEGLFQHMLAAQRASLEAAAPVDPRPAVPVLPPPLIPRPGHLSEQMRHCLRSELCRAFEGFAVACYQHAYLGAETVHAACERLTISLSEHDVPRPA